MSLNVGPTACAKPTRLRFGEGRSSSDDDTPRFRPLSGQNADPTSVGRNHEAPLEWREPSEEARANRGNRSNPQPIESTASERPETGIAQIAEIAPIPPDWRHLVESFCTLGASNEQLAQLFSVSPETLDGWIAGIPDFADAVRSGHNLADARVANRLYELAVGYSHRVERVLIGRDGPMTVSYLKHHPPSASAGKTWLENRRPQDWSPAAIKRKLQAWEDAGDAAARPPSFLSDEALAALVDGLEEAREETGAAFDREPAVDPVKAGEWPLADEPYGEGMDVRHTVVGRVAAQGILGWFSTGARRGEDDGERALDLVAGETIPVQPGATCVDFRQRASPGRLAVLEEGNPYGPSTSCFSPPWSAAARAERSMSPCRMIVSSGC